MQFEKFPSLTRFSQGWTITEKLDGTNAQVCIAPITEYEHPDAVTHASHEGQHYSIFAGSRTRWLGATKETDNYGFGRWVADNAAELVKLGEGRHYGEWYGSGIQRGYGLKNGDKRFALFNAARWADPEVRPACCEVVHTFLLDEYLDNPAVAATLIMMELKEQGSAHVPGFMNPEGVVMYHSKSRTSFKKTYDYDEAGKWAEGRA